ncbi:MAG: hypothetical protein AB8I58_00240, partial [Anaerolineales bacterium]
NQPKQNFYRDESWVAIEVLIGGSYECTKEALNALGTGNQDIILRYPPDTGQVHIQHDGVLPKL